MMMSLKGMYCDLIDDESVNSLLTYPQILRGTVVFPSEFSLRNSRGIPLEFAAAFWGALVQYLGTVNVNMH